MLEDKRKRERKRERADNMWEGQVRGKRTRKRWEMHANGVTACEWCDCSSSSTHTSRRCIRMQSLEATSSKIS